MENDKWFGVSREEIDWFPTIDYKKCSGCMACLNKCSRGVFASDNGRPKVVQPNKCVVGCTGCDKICPQQAISHPPKEYLEKLAKGRGFELGCGCGGGKPQLPPK
jgi:NAD-dependent dihydropyrimidine dehydrogenase PreA subunit